MDNNPSGTEYVVLRENEPAETGGTHSVIGTVTAANARDAVRQTAGTKQGVYRAIPARSWKPVRLTVETTTTVKLA